MTPYIDSCVRESRYCMVKVSMSLLLVYKKTLWLDSCRFNVTFGTQYDDIPLSQTKYLGDRLVGSGEQKHGANLITGNTINR